MQKSTLIILTTCLLSAVGIGAYELGTHNPLNQSNPNPFQAEQSTVPPANMSSPFTPQTSPNGVAPVTTYGSNENSRSPLPMAGQPVGANPFEANREQTTTKTTATVSPVNLTPETPIAAVPPLPGGSNVEKTTTTETVRTTTGSAPHRAYVHRYVHHHRNDKVHVARAAKHTTMFALKLPSRMSF
jgi:hypothetical protein